MIGNHRRRPGRRFRPRELGPICNVKHAGTKSAAFPRIGKCGLRGDHGTKAGYYLSSKNTPWPMHRNRFLDDLQIGLLYGARSYRQLRLPPSASVDVIVLIDKANERPDEFAILELVCSSAKTTKISV